MKLRSILIALAGIGIVVAITMPLRHASDSTSASTEKEPRATDEAHHGVADRRHDPAGVTTPSDPATKLRAETRRIEILSEKLAMLRDDETKYAGEPGTEEAVASLREHQARIEREIAEARTRATALSAELEDGQ